jgi:hypothetical protein
MASGGPSAENAGADTSASNKDLTTTGANSVKINDGIGGEDSSSYNPLNIGGNSGLPRSASSPL